MSLSIRPSSTLDVLPTDVIKIILDFLPETDFKSFLKATPSRARQLELEGYIQLRGRVFKKASILPEVCRFFMTDRLSLLADEKLGFDMETDTTPVPLILVDVINKVVARKLASGLPSFLSNSASPGASQIFEILGKFGDAGLITAFVDSQYMSQIGLESLLENFKTAALKNYAEMVISLVASRHCFVISLDYLKESFFLAVTKGHELIVQAIIKHSRFDEFSLEDVRTAFKLAAQSGFAHIIEMLLSTRKGLFTSENIKKAFRLASQNNHVEAIQFFLNHKDTSLEITDEGVQNAFTIAREKGFSDVLQAILSSSRADAIDAEDVKDAYDLACRASQQNILASLIESDRSYELSGDCLYTTFRDVVAAGCTHMIRAFINSKRFKEVFNLDAKEGYKAIKAVLDMYAELRRTELKRKACDDSDQDELEPLANLSPTDIEKIFLLSKKDDHWSIFKIALEDKRFKHVIPKQGIQKIFNAAARNDDKRMIHLIFTSKNFKNSISITYAFLMGIQKQQKDLISTLIASGKVKDISNEKLMEAFKRAAKNDLQEGCAEIARVLQDEFEALRDGDNAVSGSEEEERDKDQDKLELVNLFSFFIQNNLVENIRASLNSSSIQFLSGHLKNALRHAIDKNQQEIIDLILNSDYLNQEFSQDLIGNKEETSSLFLGILRLYSPSSNISPQAMKRIFDFSIEHDHLVVFSAFVHSEELKEVIKESLQNAFERAAEYLSLSILKFLGDGSYEISQESLRKAFQLASKSYSVGCVDYMLNSARFYDFFVENLGSLLFEETSSDSIEAILRSNYPISADSLTRAFEFSVGNRYSSTWKVFFNSSRFCNIINLGRALEISIERDSLECAEAILESQCSIPAENLGRALESAVGKQQRQDYDYYGNEQEERSYANAIIESKRFKLIPAENLGRALEISVEKDDLECAEALLKSECPIPAENLGRALESAVGKRQRQNYYGNEQEDRSYANAIIESKWFKLIPAENLGRALEISIEKGALDCAQAILTSECSIPAENLGRALESAVGKRQRPEDSSYATAIIESKWFKLIPAENLENACSLSFEHGCQNLFQGLVNSEIFDDLNRENVCKQFISALENGYEYDGYQINAIIESSDFGYISVDVLEAAINIVAQRNYEYCIKAISKSAASSFISPDILGKALVISAENNSFGVLSFLSSEDNLEKISLSYLRQAIEILNSKGLDKISSKIQSACKRKNPPSDEA